MPEQQEQYYGFTQFAMELNELDSSLRALLPSTDTRFRPDQRSEPGPVAAQHSRGFLLLLLFVFLCLHIIVALIVFES